MKHITLKIICLTLLASPVKAQDNQTLDGYTPPPLFGSSKPVKKTEPQKKIIYKKPKPAEPVRLKPVVTKAKPPKPTIVKPKIVLDIPPKPTSKPLRKIVIAPEPIIVASPNKVELPTPIAENPIAPRIESKTVTNIKAPIEPKVIVAPPPVIVVPPPVIIKPQKVAKATEEPSERFLEPIHLRKELEIPAKEIIKKEPIRKSSSGVIKGPKTMPAVKKQGVESEVLFEPQDNEKVAIFDRVQKSIKPEQASVETSTTTSMPTFDVNIKGQENISLPYQPSKISLNDQHKAILLEIISEFKSNNIDTINITSYASKISDELSSDKRISLSRALEVRNFLVSQGVEARYIKVRALGANTDKAPVNRVELNLPKS